MKVAIFCLGSTVLVSCQCEDCTELPQSYQETNGLANYKRSKSIFSIDRGITNQFTSYTGK